MNKIDIPYLLTCLRELSDINFQRQAWLMGEHPEVPFFGELVSQTFDDTGLTDAIEKDTLKATIGVEAARALEELDKLVDKVDQSLSPETLIAHPAMERVRICAKKAMQKIHKL